MHIYYLNPILGRKMNIKRSGVKPLLKHNRFYGTIPRFRRQLIPVSVSLLITSKYVNVLIRDSSISKMRTHMALKYFTFVEVKVWKWYVG